MVNTFTLEDIEIQLRTLYDQKSRLYKSQKLIDEQLELLENQKDKLLRDKIPYTDGQIENIRQKINAEYVFFDSDSKDKEYEDDGFIGVTRKGVRFTKKGRESGIPAFIRKIENAFQEII